MGQPFKQYIPREVARQYAEEAVEIIEQGRYVAPSGRVVEIRPELENAVQNSHSYPPDKTLPLSAAGPYQTTVEVVNNTTLWGAVKLLEAGLNPAVLNFASATNPGGGFLTGSRAQEEYLARSSGLYACLKNNPMYQFHRQRKNLFYSDYVLYAPFVPVFRGDDGLLLETPYQVSMITSPAVMAAQLFPAEQKKVESTMWGRILKVLAVGLAQGHNSLVLGAWGCGAFGNNPTTIANLFYRAISENFRGAYQHLIFAIIDASAEQKTITPFQTLWPNP